MTSVLLTKKSQLPVWNYLAEILKKDDLSIKMMTDPDEFYSYVEAHQYNEIDFTLVDMSAIQLDSFNPYSLFLDEGILVPVVVYNDPFPQRDQMAFYWALKNEEYFNPIFTAEKLLPYSKIWRRLQDLLNSPEINPYISCICREKEFSPSANSFDPQNLFKTEKSGCLKEKLFFYLYDRLNKAVTVMELCNYLWGSDDSKNRRHLFTCIHDLRNFLQEKNADFVKIVRDSKENYLMSLNFSE
ncbi:hypothetical protein [Treponema sp.]|uniref:helix-turn-helix domain-containing protein n=1 Tax=Treponema sp. TaxID=166 RepID=UPI0025EB3271|nr:hypothetical protein [Treponema sp.]MCR5218243.1 hypothetical protein [Treponema sp.]